MPIVIAMGNCIGWESNVGGVVDTNVLLWSDPDNALLIDSGGGKILISFI